MTIEEMKRKLEGILTPKRFAHSLGVMSTALALAAKHGESSEKAAVAGLLHDCAREIRGEEVFRCCEDFNICVDTITCLQPELLHGAMGAEIARREYGVADEEILEAIRYHTTGRQDMRLLEKIAFIADYIEPNRKFEGVEEIRKLAFSDIDEAVLRSLDKTITYVMIRKLLIHPLTVDARNYILHERIKNRA